MAHATSDRPDRPILVTRSAAELEAEVQRAEVELDRLRGRIPREQRSFASARLDGRKPAEEFEIYRTIGKQIEFLEAYVGGIQQLVTIAQHRELGEQAAAWEARVTEYTRQLTELATKLASTAPRYLLESPYEALVNEERVLIGQRAHASAQADERRRQQGDLAKQFPELLS
jgi:hypothetical protein